MDAETLFWKLLYEQAGVGSIWQACELGVPEHRIRYLVRKGALRRIYYGIVAASGAPETHDFHCHVGLLLAGPRKDDPGIRAALCLHTAAVEHDLIEPVPSTDPIHVMSTRRVKDREGLVFHWTSRLADEESVSKRGLVITDAIRTFIDMAAAHPYRALSIYRRGLRKGAFDEEAVLSRLEKEARQGRNGICRAREAVESTLPDAAEALSAREDHYADLLIEAGYPRPQRNVDLPGTFGHPWKVDLYYAERRFGVEVSPVEHHSDPFAVKRDQRKIADLAAAGVSILPVDDDLSDRDFLRLIRSILGPPGSF